MSHHFTLIQHLKSIHLAQTPNAVYVFPIDFTLQIKSLDRLVLHYLLTCYLSAKYVAILQYSSPSQALLYCSSLYMWDFVVVYTLHVRSHDIFLSLSSVSLSIISSRLTHVVVRDEIYFPFRPEKDCIVYINIFPLFHRILRLFLYIDFCEQYWNKQENVEISMR